MAPTLERVTDDYRRLQATLSGDAAGRVAVAFETLLNPSDLDRTFPLYARAVAQIIAAARSATALLAGAFYLAFREGSRVYGEVPPIAFAGALPAARLTTSLLVTGPVTVKRSLTRGQSLETAITRARVATVGAAYRMTADAGRATIRDTIRRDKVALGWARVTDGDPCYFCAMLASRGPVYLSEGAAQGSDPYHDGCGCLPAPVFDRDAEWPGRAREFEALWSESTEGLSGREAVNAFRRAHEGRRASATGTTRRSRTPERAKPREYDAALLAQAREVDARAYAAKKAGDDATASRLFAEAATVRRRAYGTT
ncbi:hypothetical protein ACPXB5_11270 [Micromonospora arida]|uniref:VG15 protein n=1 Tax=Micromonospora arida TaxID=2203715 RepID=UPI003CF25ADC